LRLKPTISTNVRQNGTLNLGHDIRLGDHHCPGNYTSYSRSKGQESEQSLEQGTLALNEKEREIELRINRIE